MIEINEYKLASIIEKATEAGANKVLVEMGLKKSHISQGEAFRRFGRAMVARWRRDGKVKPVKIGKKIIYDLSALERLQTINQLI
jgi:hypothetical protein